jgi:hypothetical protein
VEQEGVADLVRQPQPRFELIKQHYPQASGACTANPSLLRSQAALNDASSMCLCPKLAFNPGMQ